MRLREFLESRVKPYSEELGINLRTCEGEEIAKWFLASFLLGKRISEKMAMRTYREFEKAGMLSPEKIAGAKWEDLVAILDAGGYVRYDFSTASRLLEIFGNLEKRYAGDLNRLHQEAGDPRDLERKLRSLGRGIGEVTVAIFLRDMRYCWSKADPRPTALVKLAMNSLGIEDLRKFAEDKGVDVVRLETLLVRLGMRLRRGRELSTAFAESFGKVDPQVVEELSSSRRGIGGQKGFIAGSRTP